MTLTADEFLQRLALHVLPWGFVRVRAFGFLANCHRSEKLPLIRCLLDAPAEPPETGELAGRDFEELPRCPRCGEPALRTVERSPRPWARSWWDERTPARRSTLRNPSSRHCRVGVHDRRCPAFRRPLDGRCLLRIGLSATADPSIIPYDRSSPDDFIPFPSFAASLKSRRPLRDNCPPPESSARMGAQGGSGDKETP